MRLVQALLSILLFAAITHATPIAVVTDPYVPNPGAQQSNGDVLGYLALFDIESITFTELSNTNVQLVARFNYHDGDATLAQFGIGSPFDKLNVGDILFSVGASASYGIALRSHNGLTAGDLYPITNALTASEVLNAGPNGYRPDELVWMDEATAGTPSPGSVLTSRIFASGTGTPEVQSAVNFTPTAQFLTDLANGMSIHFASATCANDILNGFVQAQIPEPLTFVLLGSGLALCGVIRRRKRR